MQPFHSPRSSMARSRAFKAKGRPGIWAHAIRRWSIIQRPEGTSSGCTCHVRFPRKHPPCGLHVRILRVQARTLPLQDEIEEAFLALDGLVLRAGFSRLFGGFTRKIPTYSTLLLFLYIPPKW